MGNTVRLETETPPNGWREMHNKMWQACGRGKAKVADAGSPACYPNEWRTRSGRGAGGFGTRQREELTSDRWAEATEAAEASGCRQTSGGGASDTSRHRGHSCHGRFSLLCFCVACGRGRRHRRPHGSFLFWFFPHQRFQTANDITTTFNTKRIERGSG